MNDAFGETYHHHDDEDDNLSRREQFLGQRAGLE